MYVVSTTQDKVHTSSVLSTDVVIRNIRFFEDHSAFFKFCLGLLKNFGRISSLHLLCSFLNS